uniref:NADH-ubiquinone oxidoreductase chain 1 n=1 Tax=Tetragnatha maxillosa TaxID=216284 RepID=A0A0A0YQ30_9ARAC|nr:NADH dehydrogenase subunit 1 [Tetragnatha maxillosa]AIX11776.1 NADH dehydrogenase subunit 1 [Tetragnatha maxillosa]
MKKISWTNFLISLISILIAVAFYTILERKILSYIQIRMGPNKVGFLGILQPFSDAIKLFNKYILLTEMMNFLLASSAPSLSFFFSLILISIIPFYFYSNFDNLFSMIVFMMISGLSVYTILMIGWASNSKYASMGATRSMAQMISYEVSLFILILFVTLMSNSYQMSQISMSQNYISFFWGNLIILLMWLISCLAEVNRSPFDFAEGESELVSGFNVEFMGGWFALIFLAEYSNMLILSFISVTLFFYSIFSMNSVIPMILLSSSLLWVRASFPRFRYDLLMLLSWKMILPFSIIYFPLSMMIYSISFSI